MVDVLLTHSYHLPYDRKQVRKMQPYPPLGTLYAAALLRQHGFSVAVFDSMLEAPEEGFRRAMQFHRPGVVAIYEDNFNFLSKMCLGRMREVAFDMIDTARAAGARVVLNGSDASDRAPDYLSRGADYVLLGEAEWTLLELVESLTGKISRRIEEIHGLAYIEGEGPIVRTPPRPLMKDLDQLPLPARDLARVSDYRKAWKAAHGFLALNLVSSRGCPYKCNWCARPIYGTSFNVRSPESVALEMQELRDRYQADFLWFADDLFGLRKDWLQELAEHVEHRRAAVPFKMQSRVDLLQAETVTALKRSGCAEVWMGVESGSQKILDAMNKGTSILQIEHANEQLKAHGIRSCYFLQLGYPGETWEEIEKTIQLVRETRPDDIGVSVSYPLPGTLFHEQVRQQLGAKTNWDDSEDLSMMFKGAYTSAFYRALHDALHAEVESWSPPGAWRFSVATSRSPRGQAASDRDNLWKQVYELENVSRNADATEIPEWIFS